MSEGPLDAWSDVTEWFAQCAFSVTEEHDIISSTGSGDVVGKSQTRWQAVASARLSGPAFSWQGDGSVSGSWGEQSNIDESGQGWVEYSWSTVSGSGTGAGTIFLQMYVDGTTGAGGYTLQAKGLEFEATTTSYMFTQDPVSGVPSESYDVSTGQREVFFPEANEAVPQTGSVLQGTKQVSLSGSAIGSLSWWLGPWRDLPCPFFVSIDIDPSDTDTHEISSTLLGTVPRPLRHFVTVSGTGDIVLRATIGPDTQDNRSELKWEADGASITSPAVGMDPLTAKISRNKPTGARIRVRIKVGSDVCLQVIVWIIRCTLTADTDVNRMSFTGKRLGWHPDRIVDRDGHPGYRTAAGIEWTATILPSRIITDEDRPAIEQQPRVRPPGTTDTNKLDLGVATKGNPDATGREFSGWDMSRQKRGRFFVGNPDAHPPDPIRPTPPNWPDENARPEDYPQPQNDAEGNDDTRVSDEDSDPYDDVGTRGTLRSADQAAIILIDDEDVDGRTWRMFRQYREFVRVQLGDKWYRCSDWGYWRFHANVKHINGQWTIEDPNQPDVFDTTNNDFPP